MKCSGRIALCASLLLFIPLYLIKLRVGDFSSRARAGAYLINWINGYQPSPKESHSNHEAVEDKVIVMAKLEEEHTDWVREELPDWQRAIYTVNPSKATVLDKTKLKTPLNKGHESMAYLTYLIDFYDTLPAIIAFLHSHRSGFFMAWHVDAPLHDNVAAMRSLQLNFVQRNGYVNLRCNWEPGCKEAHRYNKHVTGQIWEEVFKGTSTPPLNLTAVTSPVTREDGPTQTYLKIPSQVAAACCAQFAVSRDQVLRRPKEDYIKIREWVIHTNKDDATSGRVMEFLWHVIFGMESVYCPDEELCYCQVYGQC